MEVSSKTQNTIEIQLSGSVVKVNGVKTHTQLSNSPGVFFPPEALFVGIVLIFKEISLLHFQDYQTYSETNVCPK